MAWVRFKSDPCVACSSYFHPNLIIESKAYPSLPGSCIIECSPWILFGLEDSSWPRGWFCRRKKNTSGSREKVWPVCLYHPVSTSIPGSSLSLPQCLCNFLGLIVYNAFPEELQVNYYSSLMSRFICIRTETRGDFPGLVTKNVLRNMETCLSVGLENFMIEVMTDKGVNLLLHPRIRDIVK